VRLVDVWLQNWRIHKAKKWVPLNAKLLDIGCHQGELFDKLKGKIGESVGIDPLAKAKQTAQYKIIQHVFSEQLPFAAASFDAITMLAVIEHIQNIEQLIKECKRVLTPSGKVIITVPAPTVDYIVEWLVRLRLADGMSLEEHHKFDPTCLPALFKEQGFDLEHWSRFQLRLNNLMVFYRN